MKPFLFVNPGSGGYALKRIQMVIALLKDVGLAPTAFSVATPAEIHAGCRRINEIGSDPLVIVAGGDGTVNAVANGLQPGSATLAVLPMGTSNVLAAELGITSVENGIQRIVRGTTRPLPLGVLQLEQECHRFLLMAGIGLDGAIVRDVWPPGKRMLKQGAYALSACVNAFSWDSSLIEVSTAGRQIECHSVIVCSASHYGGNFVIAPGCDLFTAGLTAVCVRKNSRWNYLRLAFELFRGKTGTSSELLLIPSEGLEIRGRKPIQIDGDFIGYSPARITVLPDFARIIV